MIKIANKEDSTEPWFNCGEGSVFYPPEGLEKQDYKKWFYTNLNPDIAPVGFLEQLDHTLKTAKRRNVVLGSDVYPESDHCEVILEYLEGELKSCGG